MIQTRNLSKRYGDFQALSELTLEVHRGEVFGLLGPNGSGKTTLLRTLIGFLHRSGGEAQVMGIDPQVDAVGVKRQIAYLPGDARLPGWMRGAAVLRFFAELQPAGDLDRCLAIAETLELDLRRHVGFMSTGMRQKLAIATVLGSRAPLLILDEPTANLDPTIRSRVLRLIAQTKSEGRTVVFSSHVLSEIEEVCDRVALLRLGRLVHQLVLSQLRARHRIVASVGSSDALPPVPARLAESVSAVHRRDKSIVIETCGDLAPLLPWLQSLGLHDLRIEAFGLRAVYDQVHVGEVDLS